MHHPDPQHSPQPRAGVPTPLDARADLPDLPLARPLGGGIPTAPLVPIGTPLGGGASVTVADGDAGRRSPHDAEAIHESAHISVERFTWTIASELTAGMLANPSRGHATVKDAMALFDHLLGEVRTYLQLSGGASAELALDAERARRARHSDWFHDADSATGATSAHQGGADHEQPGTLQDPRHAPAKPAPARPAPAKPAPSSPITIPRYRDLGMSGPLDSPHHHGRPSPAPDQHGTPPAAHDLPAAHPAHGPPAYEPGSMAGAAPEPSNEDEHSANRAA